MFRGEDEWSCYDYEETLPLDDGAVAPLAPRLKDVVRKIRFLRRGAQGALYEAVYVGDESRRPVVVKRLCAHHSLKEQQGVLTAHMRELALLQAIRHEHVIRLERVLSAPQGEVCLVLEKYAVDLEELVVRRRVSLSESMVKAVVLALLKACAFLRDNRVLHRDIKPSNIGITTDGVVKLADFGSARMLAPHGARYTPVGMVTTLTYSAPELLLGCREHTAAMDMWGIGVVMAELVKGKHLFDARTQLEMLAKIFKCVGTPTSESWPELETMPACQSFRFQSQPGQLSQLFEGALSPCGIDFLSRLLEPSPLRRIPAAEALQHDWLCRHEPRPAQCSDLAVVVAAAHSGARSRAKEALPVKRAGSVERTAPTFAMLADDSEDNDDEYDDDVRFDA
jgi:serine/threonine protein kinase